jgi:UDP-3-O-[3-hydroxymyristoyl] N-acetylglucosamine deacetylase/3-hydroxyacyl-[acyl-carrier-protein] dehydratase
MNNETTIKKAFTLTGPGLHTGAITHTTVTPADSGMGIIIRRIDTPVLTDIPALAENVSTTDHGTTVASNGHSVSTIEHLMSALHGTGIDNAIIEVDGPEIPILDGSARLWVENINQSGVRQQDKQREVLTITHPVKWSDTTKGIEITVEPAEAFSVECCIEFSSQLIGSQKATITGYDKYATEIARCRTFVFLHEVEILLANNLIKGGDLDNALVFVDKPLNDTEKERLAALYGRDKDSINVRNGVLNTIEPFYPNEPARHKLLDFMGDIYLVGRRINGHFTLKCPGHYANTEFAKKIRQEILLKK